MKELSRTECIVMKCVWAAGRPITATQIQEEMKGQFMMDTDRKTLGTMIYRLEEKGYLKAERMVGRTNYYVACISEGTVKRNRAKEFLSWWFDGSIPDLLSALDSEEEDEI